MLRAGDRPAIKWLSSTLARTRKTPIQFIKEKIMKTTPTLIALFLTLGLPHQMPAVESSPITMKQEV